jgi:hypothetical protein
LAVNDEDYQSLKLKLNDLRKHLNLIYSKKPGASAPEERTPKHVISLHMQLLVLTEGLKSQPVANREQRLKPTSFIQEGMKEFNDKNK